MSWCVAHHPSLYSISPSLPKLMSIELVVPYNHLILCCPFLLLPSIFPSIRVFSKWVSSLPQVAKVLELQLQHQSIQWIFRVDFAIYLSRAKQSISSSHVQMWELDHKEGWAPKNWCFWTVVLEKTLESPLDCKQIQLVHPKGNQSWIFTGRTDAEAETPILWPPDAKNQLI